MEKGFKKVSKNPCCLAERDRNCSTGLSRRVQYGSRARRNERNAPYRVLQRTLGNTVASIRFAIEKGTKNRRTIVGGSCRRSGFPRSTADGDDSGRRSQLDVPLSTVDSVRSRVTMTPRKSKHDDPRSLINDHAPDRGASRSLTESRDALFFQGDSLTPRADISTTACRLRHLDPLLPSRSSPPTLYNARELPSFASLDRRSRFAMPVLTRFPFVPISSVLSSSIALPLAPPCPAATLSNYPTIIFRLCR